MAPALTPRRLADVLPAVLAEGSSAEVARQLAEDVRWGGPKDTGQTCHDRPQAVATSEALRARGVRLRLPSTRVGDEQVLTRLQVRDPELPAEHQDQLLLTVRDGPVVDVLHLDDDAEPPVVELLHFAGCPNSEAFLPHLRQLLRRHRVPSRVQLVDVDDEPTAHRLRFLGSPSLRVDGRDVEPGADERTTYGLQCRIYSTPDGPTGTPPDAWILAALQR